MTKYSSCEFQNATVIQLELRLYQGTLWVDVEQLMMGGFVSVRSVLLGESVTGASHCTGILT